MNIKQITLDELVFTFEGIIFHIKKEITKSNPGG